MLDLPSPLAPLGGRVAERIYTISDARSALAFLWEERLYGLLHATDFAALPTSERLQLDEKLQEMRIQMELRQEVHARDLHKVMAALQTRGVTPVVLKGAALGARLYPNAASRPSVDVDMLIARHHINIMHEVFQAHGWVLASGVRGRWVSSQWSYRTQRSDALSTSVDIHWRLTNRPQLHHALSYQELLKNAHPPTDTFPFGHTISSAHALVHAVVHLIAHHANESIPALWYLDIASLESSLSPAERQQVIAIFRSRGLLSVAAQVWQACALEIGFQPSQETAFLLTYPARTPASWRLAPTTRMGQIVADLTALSGAERRGYLHELVFPPEDSLRSAYGDQDRTTPLWRLYLRRFLQRGVKRTKR